MVSIFDRRFLVVSGKGGVGKTTISACLALAAAALGKRVLLLEMGTPERLPALFGQPPRGYVESAVAERVFLLQLHPDGAIRDFFKTHVRVAAIYERILSSPLWRSTYYAAPGIKELVCIGKIYRLLEKRSWWTGRPHYDLAILDAPASGHGLSLVGIPEYATRLFFGPMKSHAQAIRDFLADPARSALILATAPDELSVSESLETIEKLGTSGPMTLGGIAVNMVFPERFSTRELAAIRAELPAAQGGREQALRCALWQATRREVEQSHLMRLAGLKLPRVDLPFLFDEPFDLKSLESLAGMMRQTWGGQP